MVSLSSQEDGFLELYQLGGHAYLKQLPCLYSAMACVCHAHLQHRASTYEKLLAGSLKARARLLTLLQKKKDPSVLRHCKQLSALLANSGLKTTPQLRQMQMEVCTEEGSRQLDIGHALCLFLLPRVHKITSIIDATHLCCHGKELMPGHFLYM